MGANASGGLVDEAAPLIAVKAWYWMDERYDAVVDFVAATVCRRDKGTPEFAAEMAAYKEIVHEMCTCSAAEFQEPDRLMMLEGEWVAKELYASIWERLRRVRKRVPWDAMALWHRIAVVHAVVYQAFRRCATIRTCDYLNLPIPVEPVFLLIDRAGMVVELDFNDAPPARTYGPLPGAGR